MRVVYVKAPYQFEIREMDIPEPGRGEALIDVRACAVCGTDMHTAAADAAYFQSFGHEIAGVVVKNGPGADRVPVGTKVVLESGTFCHTCDNCRNGRIDICTNGKSIIDDVEISGYADYLLAPEQSLVPFEGLSFAQAALAEPLGVALDLFYTTGIELNDDVAVVGLGPIGLMAIALAKAAGARNVYAIQRNGKSKARIELAKKLGATDVILTSETNVQDYPFPRGGLDKIMITAVPAVIPEMLKITNYGSIVSFLGIDNANGDITFNANDFHYRKLQLRASYAVPALWFPRALELIKSKVIDPDDFITQTFPLEEIEAYFKKQRDDISDVIKMVMVKPE
ncbi:MAG: alcohol dehydrogenase catalytic domain-containing protein [Clostridia bacterium]|nr:alcohol dehydrogenase catalytic domain-containing protein [Clostridia bacterium]